MLQMNCPNCRENIKSQFLADVSVIECGQCQETVPVTDIQITTKYLTINREDFLGQSFRFQKLLSDVEKDRALMANEKLVPEKSREGLEQFHSSLQELLAGSRDNFRLEIPRDLYVEVKFHNMINRGKLLNLSREGGSIEFLIFDTAPQKFSELDIEFFLPRLSGSLYTRAKVIWSSEHIREDKSKRATIGVTFMALDENIRSLIWSYIIENTPVPYEPSPKRALCDA